MPAKKKRFQKQEQTSQMRRGRPGKQRRLWKCRNKDEIKRMPPRLRGREPLAEAAASAAAEKKDDPDPVAAVSTAKAEAIIMFTPASTSIIAASAAAAQDKDQPYNIASGPSCITIAIAVAVTSAVCCCQIAHTNSSNNYLQFIICRSACHSFRFFVKFSKKQS